MPTATEAPRETWADWIPPDWPEPDDHELLTRDQVLDRVRALGLDLNLHTLRSWEGLGFLPHPVRRWHEGAVRAVYPPWFPELVMVAHERRRGRWSVDATRDDLRDRIKQFIVFAGEEQWGWEPIPAEFDRLLQQLAERQERLHGEGVATIDIRFLDAAGKPRATIRRSLDHLRQIAELNAR